MGPDYSPVINYKPEPSEKPPTELETLVAMSHALVTYYDKRNQGAVLEQIADAVTKCAHMMGCTDRQTLGAAVAEVLTLTAPIVVEA